MDIDIIIRGGEELAALHSKKYDALENKISRMFLDRFPEVTGVAIMKEKWGAHRQDQKKHENTLDAIVEKIFNSPKFQDRLIEAMRILPAEV